MKGRALLPPGASQRYLTMGRHSPSGAISELLRGHRMIVTESGHSALSHEVTEVLLAWEGFGGPFAKAVIRMITRLRDRRCR